MLSQPNPVSAPLLKSGSLLALGRSRPSPYVILFVLCACLMLPIWIIGLPVSGHDALAHVRWQKVFSEQFWNGDLYPRWLVDINEGLGSPAFYIYPPLPHFLAAVIGPLADGHGWAQHRLGILATLAFYASGVGAYLWLFQVTRERASALIGAIVFLVSPYHLFIDTYYRSAYAELWAFTWAPFSLWAIHLFPKAPARAVAIFSLATAALVLSHAPSCIALPPLFIAYAAVLAILERRWRILLWTCAASAAALAIAGAYLGTALTHQRFIDSSALYSGYFDFFRWLLMAGQRWPRPGAEVGMAGISVVQGGGLLLLGWLMLRSATLDATHRALIWLAMLASALILFLMTSFSAPLWMLAPVAQKIQFPWRLLTTHTVLLALVVALYVHWVRHRAAGSTPAVRQRLLLPLFVALAAVNIGLMFVLKPIFTDDPKPGSHDVPEYRLGLFSPARTLFPGSGKVRLLSGQGAVRLETISPTHLRIHPEGAGELRAVVRHYFYPGWECSGAGRAACTVSKLDAKAPLLAVHAGAGSGPVDLIFAKTPAERTGELVSIAGLALMAALCLFAAWPCIVGRARR